MSSQLKILIMGLGNISDDSLKHIDKYKATPHNAGFEFIDCLLSKIDNQSSSIKHKISKYLSAELWEYRYGSTIIVLIKPLTMMNHSGLALKNALKYYSASINDVLVVHDEIHVPLGKYKFKRGGSPGGHNGLKSIDNTCSNDYYRLRIGVNAPEDRAYLSEFVLKKMNVCDYKVLQEICVTLSEKVLCHLHNNCVHTLPSSLKTNFLGTNIPDTASLNKNSRNIQHHIWQNLQL